MSKDITGIYSITNLTNSKVYVGSSKNVYKRWSQHRYRLKNNKHLNTHLQNSWNRDGEDSFKFKILEQCEFNDLLVLERQYIEDLGTFDRQYGYNLCLPETDIAPKIVSEETKYKTGLAMFQGTKEEYDKVLSGELVRYNGELITSEERKRLVISSKDNQSKKVYQLTKRGELIKEHRSIGECARYNNTKDNYIRVHLNKIGKYIFKGDIIITEDDYSNELQRIIYFGEYSKHILPTRSTNIIWKYNLEGELINKFNTVKEAAKEIGSRKAADYISRSILHGKAYHNHQYKRTAFKSSYFN